MYVSVSSTNGIGPTQGQRKTLTRVGFEPTTLGLDYQALPTVLQGQTGTACGNLRCQCHGNEFV